MDLFFEFTMESMNFICDATPDATST